MLSYMLQDDDDDVFGKNEGRGGSMGDEGAHFAPATHMSRVF